MTIETLKSPNPRNRNGISVIKSKFLSVSSMNTLLAILKVTDAKRDVILAGGLYHRFPWRHLPPPLESWLNNLEQTPLNRSQQIPALIKRLIDRWTQVKLTTTDDWKTNNLTKN